MKINEIPESYIEMIIRAAEDAISFYQAEETKQRNRVFIEILNKQLVKLCTVEQYGYYCPVCHKQQKSPDPKRPHLKFYCTRCGQRLTHQEVHHEN